MKTIRDLSGTPMAALAAMGIDSEQALIKIKAQLKNSVLVLSKTQLKKLNAKHKWKVAKESEYYGARKRAVMATVKGQRKIMSIKNALKVGATELTSL